MEENPTICEAGEARETRDGIGVGAFAKALSEPQSFSVEGVSQTNRSVGDLIALDKHLRKYYGRKGRYAGRCPLAGMVSHMIPPGTCDR